MERKLEIVPFERPLHKTVDHIGMLTKEVPGGGVSRYCLGHPVFGIDEPIFGYAQFKLHLFPVLQSGYGSLLQPER